MQFFLTLLGIVVFLGVGWYADQPMDLTATQTQLPTYVIDLPMQPAEPNPGQEVAPFGCYSTARVFGHQKPYARNYGRTVVVNKRNRSRHFGGYPMET